MGFGERRVSFFYDFEFGVFVSVYGDGLLDGGVVIVFLVFKVRRF